MLDHRICIKCCYLGHVRIVKVHETILSHQACHYHVFFPLQGHRDWQLGHLVWQQIETWWHGLFVAIVQYSLVFPGLHMGLTVPSTNPQQFSRGAPLSCTASAKTWRLAGESHCWFMVLNKKTHLSYINFRMWLLIKHSSGTGLPNRLIISKYLQG